MIKIECKKEGGAKLTITRLNDRLGEMLGLPKGAVASPQESEHEHVSEALRAAGDAIGVPGVSALERETLARMTDHPRLKPSEKVAVRRALAVIHWFAPERAEGTDDEVVDSAKGALDTRYEEEAAKLDVGKPTRDAYRTSDDT